MTSRQCANTATGSVTDVIGPVAKELEELAESCTSVQATLSRVLDLVQHPEVEREYHILQDIDRIQQILFDLSRLLSAISPGLSEVRCEKSVLIAHLKLESLARKLFASHALKSDLQQPSHCSEEERKITLF